MPRWSRGPGDPSKSLGVYMGLYGLKGSIWVYIGLYYGFIWAYYLYLGFGGSFLMVSLYGLEGLEFKD